MRIAFVALHFAEYSLCLARALAKEHSVLLLLSEVNFLNEVGLSEVLADLPNLKVELLPHRKSLGLLLSNAFKIARLVKGFAPDVVHIQEEPKDYLALALPFMRCAPIVLTVHDPSPHSGLDAKMVVGTRRGRYIKYMRDISSAVIVHGENLRQVAVAAKVHQAKNVFSVHHGPLGTLFNVPHSANWIDGNCLFFGRVEKYKGLGIFVEAINYLNDQGFKVKGVVAGRGSELERYREQIQNKDRFEVIEKYLSVSEVLNVFQKANVVVLPYLEATQSGVSAYAVGLGRPVVASNVGGLPESVRKERTGLLVEPGNVIQLADAIRTIVNDRSLAEGMATEALAWGRNELSWEELAKETIRVYRVAVKENH